MNMVSDKIFLTVFTAFIAVITTASVIIAKEPPRGESTVPVNSQHDASLPVKQESFKVISAQDLLGGNVVMPATPVVDNIKHTVDVVVGKAVEVPQFVVLQAAALEEVLNRAITAGTAAGIKAGLAKPSKPAKPAWKKILGWTWFGVKLPYQALMLVPAEARMLTMLYFILKFKPELFTWGIKKVVSQAPEFGKFLFTEIGVPMAQEVTHGFVDGGKEIFAAYLPISVMGGLASTTTTAAETAAGLANTWTPEWIQSTALSLGF